MGTVGIGTVGIGTVGTWGPWGLGDRGGLGTSRGLELLHLQGGVFTPFGEAVDNVFVSGRAFKIFFG